MSNIVLIQKHRRQLLASIVLIQRQTRQLIMSNNTYAETKKVAAHEQYSTNPERKKAAAREQYRVLFQREKTTTVTLAAHARRGLKMQLLMSNIVLIQRQKKQAVSRAYSRAC